MMFYVKRYTGIIKIINVVIYALICSYIVVINVLIYSIALQNLHRTRKCCRH